MFRAIWDVLLELSPWLLVGAAVAGAMQALIPPGVIGRLFGGGGVWKSVLLGVPLPLCSCAVIPVGLGIKRQGASDGSTVAFLIATPQTGVDSVLVTAGMLGWPLALWKVVVALATGLAGGWLTDAVTPKKPTLPILDAPGAAPAPRGWRQRLGSGAAQADEVVRSIWLWLVVGVVASAAITTYLPSDSVGSIVQYGAAASLAAALVVSLPLYVCATASVPIAASLVAAGAPVGAAIVFLMAGPATNIATVGAVYRTLGARSLAVYLGVILAGSVLGALAIDAFLGTGSFGFRAAAHTHEHGGPASPVATGSAVLLLVWIAWCAIRDLLGRFRAA